MISADKQEIDSLSCYVSIRYSSSRGQQRLTEGLEGCEEVHRRRSSSRVDQARVPGSVRGQRGRRSVRDGSYDEATMSKNKRGKEGGGRVVSEMTALSVCPTTCGGRTTRGRSISPEIEGVDSGSRGLTGETPEEDRLGDGLSDVLGDLFLRTGTVR